MKNELNIVRYKDGCIYINLDYLDLTAEDRKSIVSKIEKYLGVNKELNDEK